MRDSHRGEAERLLVRAVEEEVRRSGGRIDGKVLLARGRGALEAIAESAKDEYALYEAALDRADAERRTLSERLGGVLCEHPCWWRVLPPRPPSSPTSGSVRGRGRPSVRV